MKKPSQLYLIVVILSLGVAAFSLFIISSVFSIPNFVLFFVIVLLIMGFFVSIINKLSSGMWEQRFQELKECETCGKTIPKEAQICPSCGHEYFDFLTSEEGVLCDYCGHLNRNNETQCEKCNGFLK